ncbi:3-oxoacyl-ACP synthase [Candidatus Epulonipiscium fishelsonii]|uniref:3-oxoacyl-ACP synthase n=1 Tax=Candidatus Epulonipiscium fishelsonii TaxID=77094 RepID=A0ACC8XAV3_9FIRM|nr:3-oxoacyl-ACP synthase [Epulopiscium sp. SCG-B11WGA-EpuloA1]ONI41981.1 3-oxoacyl-ACP synthase [Epulopiscium sp. SCG-B05WGA-EpuloA1]
MRGVKIVGTGMCMPKYILTNEELSSFIDTSDEWIAQRTGIRQRRIVTDENTIDLSVKAAKEATEGIDPLEIDLIIVGTVSPHQVIPSVACSVQAQLGATNAMAFDISAACSGFIYGSKIAVEAIRCGSAKKALVIGAEVLSKVVDWSDRGTCILFGDGAGAVLYEQTDVNKILAFDVGSNGMLGQTLSLENQAQNNPLIKNEYSPSFIKMDGRAVYRFAVNVVPISIKKALEKAQVNIDEIKLFVLHQANERIISSVAKNLNVDLNLFFKNLDKYGNTSGASIPIALHEAKSNLKNGDKIVLTGFGGGLTWGSIVVQW